MARQFDPKQFAVKLPVKPLAAQCGMSLCDKPATLRLSLWLASEKAVVMQWDTCHGCASYMREACANVYMAAEQCPGCLTIDPQPIPSDHGETMLNVCGGCGGTYGAATDLSAAGKASGWCSCENSSGQWYFDVTVFPGAPGESARRFHGWACADCAATVQEG